jgi:hypothetical protein
VLQIDTWNNDEGSWLQSTLRFVAREARELRPGRETVRVLDAGESLPRGRYAARAWQATAHFRS